MTNHVLDDEPPPVNSIKPPNFILTRFRWWLTAGIMALMLIAVSALGYTALSYQQRLAANCSALKDIATLQPQIPNGGKPTLFQIKLIIDFRNAYIGQGCGKLEPMNPSIRQWAIYYGLAVEELRRES